MKNMRKHFTIGTLNDMIKMDRFKSIAPYCYYGVDAYHLIPKHYLIHSIMLCLMLK